MSLSGFTNSGLNNSPFPEWVTRKIGEPLLLEKDWNYAGLPNSKYGALLDGTSTISRDTTNLFWGGAGSCKMLTDATSGHNSEVKTTIQAILNDGDLLAFEQKWNQTFAFAGTAFDTGIESRDTSNILQSRFRYTITTNEWKYLDNSLVFQSFPTNIGGALTTQKPVISATVGNFNGWTRAVIDPTKRLYVGFEASGLNGKIETRDMRSMNLPLTSNGAEYQCFIFILYNN